MKLFNFRSFYVRCETHISIYRYIRLCLKSNQKRFRNEKLNSPATTIIRTHTTIFFIFFSCPKLLYEELLLTNAAYDRASRSRFYILTTSGWSNLDWSHKRKNPFTPPPLPQQLCFLFIAVAKPGQ